jgi:hypothetical protein
LLSALHGRAYRKAPVKHLDEIKAGDPLPCLYVEEDRSSGRSVSEFNRGLQEFADKMTDFQAFA